MGVGVGDKKQTVVLAEETCPFYPWETDPSGNCKQSPVGSVPPMTPPRAWLCLASFTGGQLQNSNSQRGRWMSPSSFQKQDWHQQWIVQHHNCYPQEDEWYLSYQWVKTRLDLTWFVTEVCTVLCFAAFKSYCFICHFDGVNFHPGTFG